MKTPQLFKTFAVGPVFVVELLVGPSEGHRAVDEAYLLEAQFLRKHFKMMGR